MCLDGCSLTLTNPENKKAQRNIPQQFQLRSASQYKVPLFFFFFSFSFYNHCRLHVLLGPALMHDIPPTLKRQKHDNVRAIEKVSTQSNDTRPSILTNTSPPSPPFPLDSAYIAAQMNTQVVIALAMPPPPVHL